MPTTTERHTRQRAPKGSGSVRQLANGSWQVRVRGRSFCAKTLAEARAKADRAAVKPRLSRAQRSAPTVRDWLAEWLERKRHEIRPGTWAKYEQRSRLHIVPLLGKKRLSQLTPQDIDRLRDRVLNTKGVGPTTAHHVHMTLSAALHDAMRRGLVASVVTQATAAPRRASEEMITLTDEELNRLIEAVEGTPLESLYRIATTLGMRQGELLALRWKDVDVTGRGSIRVLGTARRGYDGTTAIGDPKSKNGNRLLTPLPAAILGSLKDTPRTDEFVWPGPSGGVWDARNFWFSWKATRTKAKLKRPASRRGDDTIVPRFHDLRHTAATHLLEAGIAPQTVALILGDTVQTVMKTYAHATSRGLEAAVALIDSNSLSD